MDFPSTSIMNLYDVERILPRVTNAQQNMQQGAPSIGRQGTHYMEFFTILYTAIKIRKYNNITKHSLGTYRGVLNSS